MITANIKRDLNIMPENEELENELKKLYATKNYGEVIKKINSLYDEYTMPFKIMKRLALSYFYNADYENSLKYFEKIAAQENSTENLFNVMMSLLPLKKSDQAKNVFNEIIRTYREADSATQGGKFVPLLCIPYIRYFYALELTNAEFYDEAFVQLEELKKIYMQVKVTDGTFLYLRGIPFFEDTLTLAKRIFDGLNKDFVNSSFLNDLLSSCDSEGEKYIKKHYKK